MQVFTLFFLSLKNPLKFIVYEREKRKKEKIKRKKRAKYLPK